MYNENIIEKVLNYIREVEIWSKKELYHLKIEFQS
jgi:hypothetical protein